MWILHEAELHFFFVFWSSFICLFNIVFKNLDTKVVIAFCLCVCWTKEFTQNFYLWNKWIHLFCTMSLFFQLKLKNNHTNLGVIFPLAKNDLVSTLNKLFPLPLWVLSHALRSASQKTQMLWAPAWSLPNIWFETLHWSHLPYLGNKGRVSKAFYKCVQIGQSGGG